MQLDKLLQLFIPQDKQFIPLLKKASHNLLTISGLLIDLLKSDISQREKLIEKIESLHLNADEIRRDIFRELSSNFITPFDKEDIHELAKSIDRVVDYIYGASKRIELYKINSSKDMIFMASLISQASNEINNAVSEFHNMKKSNNIKENCSDLHKIKNEAEKVFYKALGDLFENEKNPTEIIKLKEIFISMKSAINKCENASDFIGTIVIKNI